MVKGPSHVGIYLALMMLIKLHLFRKYAFTYNN
jgi:hypothetical protein